jgi:hypothetical protein
VPSLRRYRVRYGGLRYQAQYKGWFGWKNLPWKHLGGNDLTGPIICFSGYANSTARLADAIAIIEYDRRYRHPVGHMEVIA